MEDQSEDSIQNEGWKFERKDNTEERMQRDNVIKSLTHLRYNPKENEIKTF